MIKVISIIQTCSACPSQWEGLTDDNRQVYVRYRWGHLRVSVSEPNPKEEHAAVQGEEVFSIDIGEDMDGMLSYEELIKATENVIEWPEKYDDSLR